MSVESFEDIKITGINKTSLKKVSETPVLYRILFNLSYAPSEEWEKMFKEKCSPQENQVLNMVDFNGIYLVVIVNYNVISNITSNRMDAIFEVLRFLKRLVQETNQNYRAVKTDEKSQEQYRMNQLKLMLVDLDFS